MSSIIISGNTSGSVTVSAPAVAGSNVITLPASTGTAQLTGRATAVASTSGTSIDFTGIPSWAQKITVMFNGVSTNGASNYLLRIGDGAVVTSGYVSACITSASQSTSTAGFQIVNGSAASSIFSGTLTITNINDNGWVSNGLLGRTSDGYVSISGGSITLGGALDRVRITTVNGTDTFDAGTINIMWEG